MCTPRTHGFTLLELLVTLSVAVVLGSVALPWLARSVAINQRLVATHQLVGNVQFARAEAIKHGEVVGLCPSSDGVTCLPGTDAWVQGFLVFRDTTPGRPYRAERREDLLRVDRWPPAVDVRANREMFVFRPLARRSTNGTFRVCHERRSVPPRAVVVAPTGRPRTSDRLADGAPIPCPET